MDGECGFCGQGPLRESEKRYYCSHCSMTVWKNGLFFRGIPYITADRALKLLRGQKASFTCVSRAYGRPYDIEVKLKPDGKFDIDFAKKKTKKA